jgi:hypothetical protein
MADRYQIGDRKVVVSEFRDEDGVLTSPSTVTGEVKAPDGTVTPLSPTEASAGIWRMTLPAFTAPGVWSWWIAGTAGLIAADQGRIIVERKATAAA